MFFFPLLAIIFESFFLIAVLFVILVIVVLYSQFSVECTFFFFPPNILFLRLGVCFGGRKIMLLILILWFVSF